jgi:hypothetical protein
MTGDSLAKIAKAAKKNQRFESKRFEPPEDRKFSRQDRQGRKEEPEIRI